MQNIRAEVLLPTKDLLLDIPFFTKVLGMRMDEIFPADDPSVAVFSGFGLRVRVQKGEDIAENKLEAGCCFVNDFVKSDPRLPFGGIKQSGYGRELSYFGIQEFVNIKTVYRK